MFYKSYAINAVFLIYSPTDEHKDQKWLQLKAWQYDPSWPANRDFTDEWCP